MRAITRPGARLRSTLAATLVVAAALVISAVAILWILRTSLTQTVRDSALLRASDVSAAVAVEGAARDALIASNSSERSIVQVLNSSGVVLLASPEIDGEPALTTARPVPGVVQVSTVGVPVADQEPYLVVAQGVQTPGGPAIVVVAESLASANASVNTVERLLAVGFPVLLSVVAVSVFFVVGRTLRPVEEIRRKVSAISATDLGARVPVPPADDEVSRLALTMNDMLNRLQGSQAAQRRFVADASHELRSPLASIRATVEVGLRHPEAQSRADADQVVLEETDRLTKLVDDLLLLARSDELGSVGELRDVDIDDIVIAEATRLRVSGLVDVTVNVASARVTGDHHQLERLVRNLGDNAARYATSTVTLAVRTDGEAVVLVVQDDGPGVPAADSLRIFDRFVRLDPARDRQSGGAGLGLAIVAEVAHAHGGKVQLDGSETGARFIVTLPAG